MGAPAIPAHPAQGRAPVDADIILVGAGIAGLATCIFLARLGLSIAAFERATVFSEFGAGLQLSPNASRCLRALGVLDALGPTALEPTDLSIHTERSGRTLATLPLMAMAKTLGAPYCLAHRADLHAALLARARTTPGITLHLGHTLRTLKQSHEGVVLGFEDCTQPEDGLPKPVRVARGKLALGADGLHSMMGRLLFGEAAMALRFGGNLAFRALLPADKAPAFAKAPRVHLWLGQGSHLVHYPLRGGSLINLVFILAVKYPYDDASRQGDDFATRASAPVEAFQDYAPAVAAMLHSADRWRMWPLYRRAPLATYHLGRCALLGDAAHPTLPFLAQGAAMALEDGAVLSTVLSQTLRANKPERELSAALAAFSCARLARTQAIVRAASRMEHVYHASGLLAAARNATLAVSKGKTLLARQDWIYGFDALEPVE